MKAIDCRFCRYYQSQGRRGGNCQLLGAPVKGRWKACSVAVPIPLYLSDKSIQLNNPSLGRTTVTL